MVELPALRATLHVEDPHSLFAKQPHNRINQGQNEGIRRRFRQRKMKVEIRLDEGVRVLPRAVHDGDRLSHRSEMLFLGASRCQRRDFGLEDGAHFSQVDGSVRLADLRH